MIFSIRDKDNFESFNVKIVEIPATNNVVARNNKSSFKPKESNNFETATTAPLLDLFIV